MGAAIPREGFRRVMHCDLDCFFAAVEELDDPTLHGKPVIVGGDPDRRGVVSTANYVARRFGIHSAMAAAHARRLCPQAIFLRPRFERYRVLSHLVMAICDEYFVAREQVSIDEAYGELPRGVPGCQPAARIAREIKRRVREEAGLVVSIGVGQSKSIAKLASDLSKPDGCLIVKPGAEAAFLRSLPVGRLHGVGPRMRARLEQLGISRVGQLAAMPARELEAGFGTQGHWLWQLANGYDERPVIAEAGPPKSVSCEDTYERDIATAERAAAAVRELADRVAARVSAKQLAGRTVTLKVKWADFRVMTRQRALPQPTAAPGAIRDTALALLVHDITPRLSPACAIRLLGVGLSGFASDEAPARVPAWGLVQLPLFAVPDAAATPRA